MSETRTTSRTYALVGALVLLAIVLGVMGAGYSQKNAVQVQKFHDVVVGGKPSVGTLLAIAAYDSLEEGPGLPRTEGLNSTVGGTSNASTAATAGCNLPVACPAGWSLTGIVEPLANVTVTVVGIGNPPLVPITMKTDGSGEAEISLAPGELNVTLSSPILKVSAVASLQTGNVTEVAALDRATPYTVLFSQLPEDGSTGMMAPWAHAYAQVDAPVTAFSGNGSFSLLYTSVPLPSCACLAFVLPPEQQPVTVTSASSYGGLAWVTLQPKGYMVVEDIDISYLVAYTPEVSVSNLGL